MARPALEGLRILDLTQVAAGPYAAFLLGFMGAQVIKVESCSRMDISRGRANPTTPGEYRSYPGGVPGERPWNRSAHHVHRNVNKLSVTLDLSKDRGKELFLELAMICDVLMENYRAPVMDRLGLGYEAVSKANPQLVYLKISSQGDTGPERDYGSLGSTLEQTAGIASVTGYEDGVPMMTNETFPDPLVGILGVGAVMAGLRRRRKTGVGGFIDLSQREATVGVLGEALLDHSVTGRVAGPAGNTHPGMAPQGVYPCLGDDMWLAISVGSHEEWLGLCRALGRPALAGEPGFQTAVERRQNREKLDQIISQWTGQRDHYQAMHLLQAHGVAAGAVLKGGETIVDPHLEARDFWDVVDHPEAGVYKQVTTPWKLSENPRQEATPAPGLGQHNEYVLGDLLGLAPEDVTALADEGIIGTRPLEAD